MRRFRSWEKRRGGGSGGSIVGRGLRGGMRSCFCSITGINIVKIDRRIIAFRVSLKIIGGAEVR